MTGDEGSGIPVASVHMSDVSSSSISHLQPGRSPILDAAQIEVLRKYGSEFEVAAGEVLFAEGDETYDLIVLLEGQADIVQDYGRPTETVLASYGPSQFLGELGLLTGQRVYLTAVATTAGRVLRVEPARLRVVMAQELDLSEVILRAFLLRHSILTRIGSGLTLIGSRFQADTRRLLEVLARNRLPSKWLDLESSPDAETMLRELDVPVEDLPIVIVPGGPLLRNPSSRALLDALGLSGASEHGLTDVCDLLVVGGGPAGLAASVYGASEGMSTTLAEDTALGGQAGMSSRIENYLGFPAGLSGEELAARAALQAQKFGVCIMLASKAVSLESENDIHQVTFESGEVISAKSVIVATGARYNRLPLDRLTRFEGVGVFYAATQMEAMACGEGPAVIVGGGNSAGQAALFLAASCTQVYIAIRGPSLATSMSRYLIDQIERMPRIKVLPHTQITALIGDDTLEGMELVDSARNETFTLEARGLFVFIGAQPATRWLEGQLATDSDGFLFTGSEVPAEPDGDGRTPLFLETSRPGIFCVGDVRSGSVKRCATAIGEGSMAVRLVFERLQATGSAAVHAPRIQS
jgi:thioredoxin reductase (NADPH)